MAKLVIRLKFHKIDINCCNVNLVVIERIFQSCSFEKKKTMDMKTKLTMHKFQQTRYLNFRSLTVMFAII